jgi:hypothetical protein
MADAGIGEAMLISAAIGGGGGMAGSMLGGNNFEDSLKSGLKGAALGAVMGGAGAGIGSLGGAAAGAESGAISSGASLGAGAETGASSLGGLANPASPFTFATDAGAGTSTGFSGLNGATAASSPNVFGIGPQSNLALGAIGAGSALTSAMEAERNKYAPPGITPYTGILSKYNPYSAKGVQYPTHYAEGGIASLAMGGQPNQMYPMSHQEHTNFMEPSQLPTSAMAVRDFEPATNPMTGTPTQPMAEGGITSLGSYSDGGQLLKGPGDGMSDNIPARIGKHQPARLADGEFVIPADVVSHLGNGSTDAGAKHLYSMMNKVRKARTGNPKQGKQINPSRYLPA